MTANFPTSLDAFLNPAPSDLLDAVNPLLDHNYQHAHANESIAALQAKVGIDSSAVVTSLDYKVANLGTSKANLASPTFTGTPAAPTATLGTSTTQIATTAFVAAAAAALVASSPATLDTLNELATALGNDPNFATTIATQIGLKQDSASALALGASSTTAYRGDRGTTAYNHSQLTTGNPHAVTKSDVGLGNADNTSDANKPVSTAAQTALNLKVDIASALVLGASSTTAYRGDRGTTAYDHSQLVTGNPHGTTKSDLSLGNVDNTSDSNKPVSTATQTALNLKANLASPALTGTPAAPTASAGTNTTQIATTAYADALAAAVLTLANKRITKRVVAVTNSATPTANTDNADQFNMDALNVAITNLSTNLTGTPTDGETKVWRIKDDGTARALNLGAKFAARGAALPTTTVVSKWLYIGALWNATAAVWDVTSVSQEA